MTEQKKERGWYLKNASPEEKARIARMGGQAVSKDKDKLIERGRKGGLATARNKKDAASVPNIPETKTPPSA